MVVLFAMAYLDKDEVSRQITDYLNHLRTVTIRVTGKDLRDMGIPQGPIYRKILDHVKMYVLDTGRRDRLDQLEAARSTYERLTK